MKKDTKKIVKVIQESKEDSRPKKGTKALSKKEEMAIALAEMNEARKKY